MKKRIAVISVLCVITGLLLSAYALSSTPTVSAQKNSAEEPSEFETESITMNMEPSDTVTTEQSARDKETYTDVMDGIWYKDSVDYVTAQGLMNGVGNNKFDPDGTVTRGMLVTILYRMEESPDVAGLSAFSDVMKGSYYENAVIWAASRGIVNGYSKTRFAPEAPITREQVATILHRYANDENNVSASVESLSQYTDIDEISEYAQGAMSWAVSEGLLNGTSRTTLSPKGETTRAQIAAIIMRYEINIREEMPKTDDTEDNANGDDGTAPIAPQVSPADGDTPSPSSGNETEITPTLTPSLPSEGTHDTPIVPEIAGPNIVVDSISAKPGDTDVEVHISILSNPGILGMTLSVLYDDSALKLKGGYNGDAVKDVLTLTKPGKYVPQCRFMWDAQEITPEDIQDGDILILHFAVADDASDGVYPIVVFYNDGDIIDNDLSPITVTVSNGSIAITK